LDRGQGSVDQRRENAHRDAMLLDHPGGDDDSDDQKKQPENNRAAPKEDSRTGGVPHGRIE
jgi:hypothetical protein